MATKNNPGAYDCYAHADPDEPLFVLLARDRHAPVLVYLWAMMRELEQEDPAKVQEAVDCAVKMMKWAKEHGRRSRGLGHAALVAVMDLTRMANLNRADSDNEPTTVDDLRRVLAGFAGRPEDADPAPAEPPC